jgi:hypothetical protein
MDELERALEDCNTSLQLNPSYLKALNNKATVLFEMGDSDQAV